MFKELVIGEGSKGFSATGVNGYYQGRPSISHNKVSYWISYLYLDLSMTIFKDTSEGMDLSIMIGQQKPIEEIEDFLNNLVLQNVSIEELKHRIVRSLEEAYEQGQRDKAEQIRNALGIY